MKTTIYNSILLIAIGIFCSKNSIAGNQTKTDTVKSSTCLEVLGIALNVYKEPINGVEVRLYKENEEMEWAEITSVIYHEHSFIFKLDANEYYTIEISKPGFVTRTLGISTKVPSTLSLKQMFRYEFQVELFQKKEGVDDYYLDFPVALISYDKKNDVFDNNNAYTKHIKTKINEAAGQASGTELKQRR